MRTRRCVAASDGFSDVFQVLGGLGWAARKRAGRVVNQLAGLHERATRLVHQLAELKTLPHLCGVWLELHVLHGPEHVHVLGCMAHGGSRSGRDAETGNRQRRT